MSLSNQNFLTQAVGNGVTTAVSTGWPFIANTDVYVYLTDTSTGIVTTLTNPTNYTLTGAGVPSGGTVNFVVAPALGIQITILRNVPLTQLVNIVDNSALNASSLNNELDKLTMIAQQLSAPGSVNTRAIQFPTTDLATLNAVLPSALLRAGKIIGFDTLGNVTTTTSVGMWRGDWLTGIVYNWGDVFSDGSTSSIYVVIAQPNYTSGASVAADLSGGYIVKAIDGSAIAASAAAQAAALVNPYDANQYAVATGTNSYTATFSPAVGTMASGYALKVKVSAANTGASTLNAVAIQKNGSALTGGEIASNQVIDLVYDGSNFQLMNPTVTVSNPTSATDTVMANISGTTQAPSAVALMTIHDAMEKPRADVASASTTNIGAAASPYVRITGTTTITAFDATGAGAVAGIVRRVLFSGALTLTHNGTSLILPTSANITTAAGDTAVFISEGGGNWRCLNYTKAAAGAAGAYTLPNITVDQFGRITAAANGTVPPSGFSNMVVYTSSGTWTVPTGVTKCKATVVGGGGCCGTGIAGGAGGTCIGIIPVTPGANMSVTVGAGGYPYDGGASSFSSLTANGGGYTGWGGTASGGSLNIQGQTGQLGTTNVFGGDSMLGKSARPNTSASGVAYGYGGSSGAVCNVGGSGIVIIEY